MQLGLAGRIWACIGILVAGYAISTGYGLWSGIDNAAGTTHARAILYPSAIDSFNVVAQFKELQGRFKAAFDTGEMDAIDDARKADQTIVEQLQAIAKRHTGHDQATHIAALLDRYQNYFSRAEPLYTEIANGTDFMQYMADLKELTAVANELAESFEDLASTQEVALQKRLQRIADQTAWQWKASLVLFVAVLGVGIGMVAWIVLHLTRDIREVATSIRASTQEIDTSSRQVLEATDALTASAAESSASISQMSTRLAETVEVSQTNSQRANEADREARDAADAASEGEASARQIADQVAKQLEEMSLAVNQIQEAAADTSKVVESISEIAFQTNLLALNAAIEAARAGQAGLGFAVVAEEVRNLAQRSAEEASETERLIQRCNESARDVEKVSTDVRGFLLKSIEERLITTFSQVNGAIGRVSERIADVATHSNEQQHHIAEITDGAQRIDSVIRDNVKLTDQSAAESRRQNEHVERLGEAVEVLDRLTKSSAHQRQTDGDDMDLDDGWYDNEPLLLGHGAEPVATRGS